MYDYEPVAPATTVELPPTKVCRRCSVQSATFSGECPHCGKSYLRRSRTPSKLTTIIAAAAVVVIAAVVAAVLVKSHSDDHQRAVAAAASRSAAAASSKSAAAAASRSAAAQSRAAAASVAAKRQAQNAERAVRRSEIQSLQRAIKKDATKDVNLGILDGPILRVDCTPLGGGSTDDLTARTGTFSCLAVNKIDHADGTESGYGFSAVINWHTGEGSWHLGNS